MVQSVFQIVIAVRFEEAGKKIVYSVEENKAMEM
jgi:hypothetical protein